MRTRAVHGCRTTAALAAAALLLSVTLLLPGTASALPDFDRPDRWFDDHVYHHYADLTTELQQLQSDHPHYVDLTAIGTSVMGRSLWTVRVTDPSVPAEGKHRVYIDGEHHGNEQLGGELCILLLRHLLEDQGDPDVQEVLAGYEVWVTPMLNPDGNTRDQRGNVNGVDLNRNYPYAHRPGGSRGDGPASEPEVQANVAFMEGADLDLYVTMHTGIVRLIYPWSHTLDPPPDRSMYENLTDISESHGITYGQASEVLYIAAGTSKDFAYGALGVPSFTFEVDDQQTRQISTREDIASRLGDELDLLMDLILATPLMGADLLVQDTALEAGGTSVEVRVGLENLGLTPANNTTVTVEAWDGARLVAVASRTLDVPAGEAVVATVRVEVGEGTYTLRTLVEYPRRLQENSSVERMVLESREVELAGSLLSGAGGWGIGLLAVLVALGVAILFWARRRGLWRPGMVYHRVMSRLGRGSGT